MPALDLPVRLIVATPRPGGGGPGPSREWTEALYDVAETQSERLALTWLWPPTLGRLCAEVGAADAEAWPTVICVDAAVAPGGEGLLWEDDAGRPVAAGPAELAVALVTPGAEDPRPLVLLALHGPHAPHAARELEAALAAAGAIALAFDAGDRSPLAAHRWAARLAEAAAGTPLAAAAATLALAHPGAAPAPCAAQAPAAQAPLPAWRRLPLAPEAGGLPAEPAAGFVGRATELAALERAVRQDRGVPVLLHGAEGLGKTALAAHLARWLVRVGAVSRVVYTDLSAGDGPAEAALGDLSRALLGAQAGRESERFRAPNGTEAAANGAARRCERVERALRGAPTLIVWDGLHALLPGGETALPPVEMAALGAVAGRLLAVPGACLCLLADTPELPAEARAFAAAEWRIAPLAPADADTVAERALRPATAHGLAAGALGILRPVLGGHPLAWATLGAAWAADPPRDEAALRAALANDAGVSAAAAPLAWALAALWHSLPPEVAEGLRALGILGGGFMEPLGQAVFGRSDAEWALLRGRLLQAGLADELRPKGFSAPYLRLHQALARRLAQDLAPESRAALAAAQSQHYVALLDWLAGIHGRSPESVHAIARLELPNLRRALHGLLDAGRLDAAVEYGRRLGRFLGRLRMGAEQEAVDRQIEAALNAAVPAEGPLNRPGVRYLLAQAQQLADDGHGAEGIAMMQQLCGRIGAEEGLSYGEPEATLDRGTAFGRLGRMMVGGSRTDLALMTLTRAQQLLESAVRGETALRELDMVYIALGQVLLTLLQYDRAEAVLHEGLSLATELADEHAVGTVCLQLGMVAAGRGDRALAAERFGRARVHLGAVDDTVGLASATAQLAALAHQRGELAEAEQGYGEALALAREADQDALAAQLHLSLAQVTEQAERYDAAQGHYAEAIRIYQQGQMRPALAAAEAGLAELLLHQGQFAAARIHAEAARAVAEGPGGRAMPWRAYLLLQRIAAAEGDTAKADHWRRRTQETFAASPDAEGVREHWRPLVEAVVRAGRGEALAQETVERVERLEASEEWRQLAEAIWRILSGERGERLWHELDHIDALVVRQILDRLRDEVNA